MKIRCIDVDTPRTDGKTGKPTGLTLGKEYLVAESNSSKFSIIDDNLKMSRYSSSRFEIIENTPIPPIRENFNTLTTSLRTKIKELELQLKKVSN